MQEKTNDPAKRTQPYETSGGFGFYSVNRDYPYAEPRRPQSSLSAFGYTDYSAAFEDLHSLDGFDMGMDDSFRPRARDPFEDTDRMRRQLRPWTSPPPRATAATRSLRRCVRRSRWPKRALTSFRRIFAS